MNKTHQTSRMLGLAFVLQFVTSIASGMLLRSNWYAPGDINASLIKIASNAAWLRANIIVDMLTALGVIFLGAMLFIALRKQNEKLALTALGFYILEAALLATSRLATFALLRFGEEFATTGQAAYLPLLGQIAFDAMEFVGGSLHMLAFTLGAVLFYYLLDKARLVPRVLSLWGLIAVLPFLIGTPLALMGYEIPVALYLPYIPFELVIGIWIM
ncbi:MAG: DUF4386 domain-containing protein, partial [Chloroflexi bacterium]|nr:DUF4386 domain-containing protein [Chloroflexota bacterium]